MSRVPAWVLREIKEANQTNRNNQIVRLAPRLLENGWPVDKCVDTFSDMFPTMDEDEIERTVIKCQAYINSDKSKSIIIDRKLWYTRGQRILPKALKEAAIEIEESTDGHFKQTLRHIHLFEDDDLVWSGNPTWSENRFFRVGDATGPGKVRTGPYICASTFVADAERRSNQWVKDRRFLVLESDTLSMEDARRVIAYLAKFVEIKLIVFSGNKSLHTWIPYPDAIGDMKTEEFIWLCAGLGFDPASTRPSQPVRLAGRTNSKTSRVQSIVWPKA